MQIALYQSIVLDHSARAITDLCVQTSPEVLRGTAQGLRVAPPGDDRLAEIVRGRLADLFNEIAQAREYLMQQTSQVPAAPAAAPTQPAPDEPTSPEQPA